MPAVNHFERAYRAWDILVAQAEAGRPITYKDLARHLGIHHRPARYLLAPIQDYCMGAPQLPPLTILVVDQFGNPGAGFIAWSRDNLEEGRQRVFSYPWGNEENPFQFAANGQTYASLIAGLLSGERSTADTYAVVRVRGSAQLLFRAMMMELYGESCAFSDISMPTVVEAAHILPWSECDPGQRLDPRNGLVLSVLHHRLFDSGMITLEDDYSIRVTSELLQGTNNSPVHDALFIQLDGKRMRLPRNPAHWPAVEYIKRRHQA